MKQTPGEGDPSTSGKATAELPAQKSQAWDAALLRNPHAVADKRSRVQHMFTAIAPSYDLNNRLHSLWTDQRWRRRAVKLAGLSPGDAVVDVACGTGDLTLRFARELRRLSAAAKMPVIGIDFTYAMLPLACRKTRSAFAAVGELPADAPAVFVNGDAQNLPLADGCADVVSIAFGIRNVSEPLVAIREFFRILKPGGRLIILEFSLPASPLIRGLYNFYFRRIVPRTATLISGDKTGAYTYLPESVNTFISREQMMAMMRQAGFENVEQHPLTFGVCVCYRGVKR